MASQNAFAETFLGNWNSSQGKTSVASAIQANSLQDIVDGQYAFELTDQANVIINLNSPEDPYLFLLSTDNNNQIQQIAYNDNGPGLGSNSQITQTLDPGKYIIVATTYLPQKNTDYQLTVTFSSSFDDYIYSGAWSDSDARYSSYGSIFTTAGIQKPLSVLDTISGPKYRFTIDSQKEVRILLDSTREADVYLYLLKITDDGQNVIMHAADDDSGNAGIAGVN